MQLQRTKYCTSVATARNKEIFSIGQSLAFSTKTVLTTYWTGVTTVAPALLFLRRTLRAHASSFGLCFEFLTTPFASLSCFWKPSPCASPLFWISCRLAAQLKSNTLRPLVADRKFQCLSNTHCLNPASSVFRCNFFL